MIRVLRLLEYEFASNELAEQHLERLAVPQNGVKKFGAVTIKSATIVNLDPSESELLGYQRRLGSWLAEQGYVGGEVTHIVRQIFGER